MNIGVRLKLIRGKFGLSLDKAAAIFDVSAQTLCRYENGKRTPDNEFLEKFGKYFKLSGDWLLYGESPIFKDVNAYRDTQVIFLELANVIKQAAVSPTPIPEMIKVSLEKCTEERPDNFILMLEYMLKDELLRKKMFQFFHLFQKPEADKRGNYST